VAAIKISLRIRRSGTMHAVDHLVQPGNPATTRTGGNVLNRR
jgi:hypothetical protein